jgi:DNA-binding MarR family transcriptional regulator
MSNAVANANIDQAIVSLMAAFFRPDVDIPARARDLSLGQLRLFFLIRTEGPLTMGRIAELFGTGQAAATGFVERIERHGFLERRHRSDDRRVVECHLTAEGAMLLDELGGLHRESLARALSVLTDEELGEFDRLLRLIGTRSGHEAGCMPAQPAGS